MKSRKTFFSLLAFFLVFAFGGPLLAADALIEKVIYQEEEGGSASVVFHLNGPHLPKVFALKGEKPRVVFDFPETRPSRKVPAVINPGGTSVRSIRVGIHSDKTRVVIDLVPGAEYRFDQNFEQNENVLTILLYPTVSEKKHKSSPQAAPPAVPEKTEVIKPVMPAAIVEPVDPEGVAEESDKPVETAAPVEPEVVSEVPAEPEADPRQEAVEKTEQIETESVELAAVPMKDPASEEAMETVEADEPAPDALLSEVSFENTSNNGEMALFKLNGFYPPAVSGEEEGTPRVLIDFPGTRLGADVKRDLAIHGNYVDRIQVEQLADPLRVQVTLELIPNKNYDLQQVFFKEDNLFVVIVNSYEMLEEIQAITPDE